MQTFTQALTDSAYVEVLNGGTTVVFDSNSSAPVRVIFIESATAPGLTDAHSIVRTWPDSWDFAAEGMVAGTQRIWVRADDDASGVTITGVRG
jgi:hypothetical protein